MLAILQSLRMQQPGCVSGVTGDSGCSGSAFMLCHSWDSLAEVCLSKGSTLEKWSVFFKHPHFAGWNILGAGNYTSWDQSRNLFLCQHSWGCPTEAACPGTGAELLQESSLQGLVPVIPNKLFDTLLPACEEFGEAGGVWSRGCLAEWPWLDLGACVWVLPTPLLFVSWDSLVFGMFWWFPSRLCQEMINDPWQWGVVVQLS